MKIHYMIIIILAIICNQNVTSGAIKGDSKAEETDTLEQINLTGSHHTNTWHYISSETEKLEINIIESHHSTINICLPKSVKEIDVSRLSSHHSHLYIYAEHNPKINHKQAAGSHMSSINVMHPIRQYTYHMTACFAATIAFFYYLSRD